MYFAQSRSDLGQFGATISVPASGNSPACSADERRIHPVVEPPASELVNVERRHGGPRQLHQNAYAAYQRLKAAAEADGIPANLLTIASGYRSVASQQALWEGALQKYGSPQAARRWVAPPGGSPHHTGRAIDFNLGGRNNSENVAQLRQTAAYRWLVCNASRFGFFPYAAEPWHWEYNPPADATSQADLEAIARRVATAAAATAAAAAGGGLPAALAIRAVGNLKGYGFGQAPAATPTPRPGPVVCPPTTCTPVGSIVPSRHGFKFANSFSASIPLPRPLPSIPARFGLCGGMASAALDYFLSCIPIPSATMPPTSGTPLFSYLLRRQIDSLGGLTLAVVPRFLAWTNLPDTRPTGVASLVPGASLIRGLQELTVPEFRATVASVAAGSPVVLGLIYVGPGAVNIWENHQVLAYGTTGISSTVTDIKIYDPNYPSNDRVVIRCELLAGSSRVRCVEMVPGAGTKTVRGFFRMPYTRVTPPCLP